MNNLAFLCTSIGKKIDILPYLEEMASCKFRTLNEKKVLLFGYFIYKFTE